eukprot:CAMPEP_0201870560 /NCGR_PEP_ID=MMETSP0902-20130614/3642_1 /ASSEMBLY_ACC=CAM_ASM_000551 /TAXON_ID=420261 /ORGANISM="Thalassiosira antarctica, Strain CCMP982" /LENGTH=80 /DNA_ID=CAMNT_0048396217 /DNA_START=53 /DNA_END=295 /DNA_ORIENTATION=-
MSENRGRQLKEWTLDHRLDTFVWGEACEYPLPDEYHAEDHTSGQNIVAQDGFSLDKCTMMLIWIGGHAFTKEDLFTMMEK